MCTISQGGTMDQTTPVKNALRQRFELEIDGKIAFLEYQVQGADELAFTHTFVPPELRGRNLAAILTRHALEDARHLGKKVRPLCSYVRVFIERHKEYAGLESSGEQLP